MAAVSRLSHDADQSPAYPTLYLSTYLVRLCISVHSIIVLHRWLVVAVHAQPAARQGRQTVVCTALCRGMEDDGMGLGHDTVGVWGWVAGGRTCGRAEGGPDVYEWTARKRPSYLFGQGGTKGSGCGSDWVRH
jgi:hypothetical protein